MINNIYEATKIIVSAPEDSIYFKTNLSRTGLETRNGMQVISNFDYANQIVEIKRTMDLLDKLEKLSKKVSYSTQLAIRKYSELLNCIIWGYESGQDTLEFDAKAKEVNDFVDTHIVKRPAENKLMQAIGIKRTTFREVGREDLKKQNKPYLEVRAETQKKFDENLDFFAKRLKD